MITEKIIERVMKPYEEFAGNIDVIIDRLKGKPTLRKNNRYVHLGRLREAIKKALLLQETELKRKHPKGFCYICGKLNSMSIHHLKSGKTIPLCRKCHNEVEEAKVYTNSMRSRKSAYSKGKEEFKGYILKSIDGLIKKFSKIKEENRRERLNSQESEIKFDHANGSILGLKKLKQIVKLK